MKSNHKGELVRLLIIIWRGFAILNIEYYSHTGPLDNVATVAYDSQVHDTQKKTLWSYLLLATEMLQEFCPGRHSFFLLSVTTHTCFFSPRSCLQFSTRFWLFKYLDILLACHLLCQSLAECFFLWDNMNSFLKLTERHTHTHKKTSNWKIFANKTTTYRILRICNDLKHEEKTSIVCHILRSVLIFPTFEIILLGCIWKDVWPDHLFRMLSMVCWATFSLAFKYRQCVIRLLYVYVNWERRNVDITILFCKTITSRSVRFFFTLVDTI